MNTSKHIDNRKLYANNVINSVSLILSYDNPSWGVFALLLRYNWQSLAGKAEWYFSKGAKPFLIWRYNSCLILRVFMVKKISICCAFKCLNVISSKRILCLCIQSLLFHDNHLVRCFYKNIDLDHKCWKSNRKSLVYFLSWTDEMHYTISLQLQGGLFN